MLKRSPSGFSLIELMIVVVIIAILTLLAIPAFAEWLQNSQTRSVAESLQNGIRFAQSESARLSRLTTIATTATSWTVSFVPIAGSTDAYDAQASKVLQSSPSVDSTTIKITPNVAANAMLAFNNLGRVFADGTGIPVSLGNADAYFNVVNSSASATRKLRVYVSPGGKVRMCDPDKTFNASTTPDGC